MATTTTPSTLDVNQLDSSYEQAEDLTDREEYAQAEKILTQALVPFAKLDAAVLDDHLHETLAGIYNLRGLCLRNLDRLPEAVADFREAHNRGTAFGALNLAETLAYDLADFQEALAVAEELLNDATSREELGSDKSFYVLAVQALSLICLGREAEASVSYRALESTITEPEEQASDIQNDLQKFVIEEGRPLAALASKIAEHFEEIASGKAAPAVKKAAGKAAPKKAAGKAAPKKAAGKAAPKKATGKAAPKKAAGKAAPKKAAGKAAPKKAAGKAAPKKAGKAAPKKAGKAASKKAAGKAASKKAGKAAPKKATATKKK